jgi:hypothetical protein
MRKIRNAFKILLGKPKGRDHSEDLGTNGSILKLTLQKKSGNVWTGFICLRIETSSELL